MAKKKRKKQKSKASSQRKTPARKQSAGLFGLIGQMSDLTKYTGQPGFRAQITGKDMGPSHGKKPMKYASLMGGKKLVMTGKDKGKII